MSISSFSTTVDNRYFEDYVPGLVHEFGSLTVTEDEATIEHRDHRLLDRHVTAIQVDHDFSMDFAVCRLSAARAAAQFDGERPTL